MHGGMECASFMIVDIGCQKLVAATRWLGYQEESLWPYQPPESAERHVFRFGANAPTPSLGRVRLPCGLAGHLGELRLSRVVDDVLGLLSQAAITSLMMVIDIHRATIHVGALD